MMVSVMLVVKGFMWICLFLWVGREGIVVSDVEDVFFSVFVVFLVGLGFEDG